MKEQSLMSYLEQQMRTILAQRRLQPDRLWDRITGHEPSDEEIMGMLSIATITDEWSSRDSGFPTQFEALAALPEADRALICQEFRRLLKSSGGYQ